MAFFHEFRRRRRAKKWRRLRVQLVHWERLIAYLDTELADDAAYGLTPHPDIESHLALARARRNKTLRRLGALETKEKNSV